MRTISTRTRKTVNTNRRSIATVALVGMACALLGAASGSFGQQTPAGQTSTSSQDSTSTGSQGSAGDQKETPQTTSKSKSKPKEKPYGLIFGTAYGPDDHPMYGVHVTIHPEGHSRPSWELMSDHRGEFAQRVPPGPGDYLITGEVEIIPMVDGKPQKSQKKRLKGQAKVHLGGEEEQDFSLHMNE
jgi:hypothetical protein